MSFASNQQELYWTKPMSTEKDLPKVNKIVSLTHKTTVHSLTHPKGTLLMACLIIHSQTLRRIFIGNQGESMKIITFFGAIPFLVGDYYIIFKL